MSKYELIFETELNRLKGNFVLNNSTIPENTTKSKRNIELRNFLSNLNKFKYKKQLEKETIEKPINISNWDDLTEEFKNQTIINFMNKHKIVSTINKTKTDIEDNIGKIYKYNKLNRQIEYIKKQNKKKNNLKGFFTN